MKSETYCIDLSVEFDPRGGRFTPVRAELDFGPPLKRHGADGLVDPHTLIIRRRVNGRERRYPVQFDERLYYGNRGWVAWLADDPEAGGEWRLSFSARGADGTMAPAPYRPMVGVGDEVYYNGPRWRPIAAPGMHTIPLAVDWDGDGRVDVISTSHYSNAQGMPWAGVFFWRNIGSNRRPRFAAPMRLYANGVDLQDGSKYWHSPNTEHLYKFRPRKDFISEYYIRVDTFDWFGTGRPDLITCGRTGGLRVYRNTGARDKAGLPVLERALKIPLPKTMAPCFHLPMRVVDWDGSGRPSILLGPSSTDFGVDYGQILLMLNTGGTRQKPRFKVVPLSRSDRPVDPDTKDLSKIQSFPDGRTFVLEYFDIDRDRRKELLLLHYGHRPQPVIEVWRNVGTFERPVMMQGGILPWSAHYTAFGFRFVNNAAFDGCLVGSVNSGYGIHYLKRVKDDPFDPKAYRDTGPLLGEGAKLKFEGYVRPSPGDFFGTGRMDLVGGDEVGFVTLARNIGPRGRPAFDVPRKVRDRKGQIVHLRRENILFDNDLERDCGQLKPQVCDWDGDGTPDIIVGNTTNRILWLRKYDPKRNRIRDVRELKVRGAADPFGWRKGQAILDFDGDGRLELITADSGGRICLFRQTKDPGVLMPGVPLRYTNGRVVTSNDVRPNLYRNQLVWLWSCDWTGSGTNDLIIGSNLMVSLLENAGTNRKPRFKKPVVLRTPDGDITIGHHETQPASYDWDGDGRPDLLIGGENGAVYLFHRDWVAGIQHRVKLGMNVQHRTKGKK
jgi:hypothetical protein